MAPGLAAFLAADLASDLVPDLAPDPLPDLVHDVAPDFVPDVVPVGCQSDLVPGLLPAFVSNPLRSLARIEKEISWYILHKIMYENWYQVHCLIPDLGPDLSGLLS